MNLLQLSKKNIRILRFNFLHNSQIWQKLVQFKLSDIGEGIAEVQLKEWHVKVGDQVNEFDELCAVQSDKASVTITSRYSGTIKKLYFQPDDTAKVGQPLIDIELPDDQNGGKMDDENDQKIEAINEKAQNISSISLQSQTTKILASPAVRRLIKEHGLASAEIKGTGPAGRVLKEDILILRQIGETNANVSPTILSSAEKSTEAFSNQTLSEMISLPDNKADLGEQIVPIRGHARAMIKTMTEALAIPHFGYGDEILADELVAMRSLLAPVAKQKGIRLSYMPIIIKATSLALLDFPVLNSSLDERKENLIYKNSHNISFAMDTPDGLAVPNVKNCQHKNIWQIAVELNNLMGRGKAKRFTKEDLTGGTFTLSNIGSIGGTFMNPVILPPQVAIGAIGKIRMLPRYDFEEGANEEDFDEDEDLCAKNVMNVFWAADHRVIDGATLARFSNRFKQFLEKPALMLAEMR